MTNESILRHALKDIAKQRDKLRAMVNNEDTGADGKPDDSVEHMMEVSRQVSDEMTRILERIGM